MTAHSAGHLTRTRDIIVVFTAIDFYIPACQFTKWRTKRRTDWSEMLSYKKKTKPSALFAKIWLVILLARSLPSPSCTSIQTDTGSEATALQQTLCLDQSFFWWSLLQYETSLHDAQRDRAPYSPHNWQKKLDGGETAAELNGDDGDEATSVVVAADCPPSSIRRRSTDGVLDL